MGRNILNHAALSSRTAGAIWPGSGELGEALPAVRGVGAACRAG
jgi:hypothetical protein